MFFVNDSDYPGNPGHPPYNVALLMFIVFHNYSIFSFFPAGPLVTNTPVLVIMFFCVKFPGFEEE